MHTPPALFIDFLADRSLKPAAARLRFGNGDPVALLALFEDALFSEMTATLPCVIDVRLAERLPDKVRTAFLERSCAVVEGTAIAHSDAPGRPLLPAGARWLAGDWDLVPPTSVTGKQSVSRTTSLKLLQCVATDADTREIEAVLRQDPVLAYHLLRLVNSLAVGGGRTISSFAQAILMLGRQQLKRWLNLLLFAASRDDHRSPMLLARTTLRARRMELLAAACGDDRSTQDRAFLAGMFSMLGILFATPLAEILPPLKLNPALEAAVLERQGELGQLLSLVESAERNDEQALRSQLDRLRLPLAEFNRSAVEAIAWTSCVVRERNVDD